MRTLLLTRSETEVLLEPDTLLAELRAAFRGYSLDRGVRAQRVRSALPGPGTATVLFPGTAADIPAYTVKVHAKFPEQQPAIRGVLCLCDGQTGELLAVMDSTHLTAVRTGLCSALATDVLARRDARSVAVIGAGMQGDHQLRSLHMMRQIGAVRFYDTAPDRALTFAERMRQSLGLTIEVSDSVAEALEAADMVLAATWARTPFILPGMLQPGTHVSTIGPDEPGKCEVSAEVIRDAVFVCDDRDLAFASASRRLACVLSFCSRRPPSSLETLCPTGLGWRPTVRLSANATQTVRQKNRSRPIRRFIPGAFPLESELPLLAQNLFRQLLQ